MCNTVTCYQSVRALTSPLEPVLGVELGLRFRYRDRVVSLSARCASRNRKTLLRMETHQSFIPNLRPPPPRPRNGCHQALTLEADRVFKRTVKEDHDFNEFQQQREKVTCCARSVLSLVAHSSHEHVGNRVLRYVGATLLSPNIFTRRTDRY